MDRAEEYLLDALRCAVHGKSVTWSDPVDVQDRADLLRLAREHRVLPLVMQASYESTMLFPERSRQNWVRIARRETIGQAHRTAEFLALYEDLNRYGLQPTVIKGIILRDMYPKPEQRASVDEDILVTEEEFSLLHRALTDCGLSVVNAGEPLMEADEVSYRDDSRGLYLEVHKRLFSSDSAFAGCNEPFTDALQHTTTVQIAGVSVRTLSPTDHILFLLYHAYKHFLHGGIGIRQVCDLAIFAEAYGNEIDWQHVRQNCESIRIGRFASALFAIADNHLGFAIPEAFRSIEVDESDLLEDILSGGLYGVEDINRAHSSTLTLDAVASDRSGKRRGGILRSVFLPAAKLRGRFPYLRRYPVLLPVAWGQRIWGYLSRRNGAAILPARSIEIGNRRIELLKEYGIID